MKALLLLACVGSLLHAEDEIAWNWKNRKAQETQQPIISCETEQPQDQSIQSQACTQKGVCSYPLRGSTFDPNAMSVSNQLWLDGEALLWQSSESSLDYAIESDSTSTIKHGRVKNPDFSWDWGFRLGLGYKMPHDKWDVFVNYTYVHAHAERHHTNPDHVVFPLWGTSFGNTAPIIYADTAEARWHANLNMADLELGRNCNVSKWLAIRPFMGVRGLVINQNYQVNYKGGTFAPGDDDQNHLHNDFWGVGIRMGADTLWGLGCGFGIYGDGSASLLSGHFDVHERERLEHAGLTKMSVSRNFDNIVVAADIAMGLQWDLMFNDDRCHFGVKFGWEFDMFFDQNQLFNFLSSTLPGSVNFKNDDLSFQGLTMGLRLDF